MVVPTWNTLYELPGGGIEVGESIREGITRECYEETGYSIELFDMPFHVSERNFYHRHKKRYYHSVIIVYQANLLAVAQNTDVINTFDGDEISKIEWKPLQELNENNCHPIAYPSIGDLKKKSH